MVFDGWMAMAENPADKPADDTSTIFSQLHIIDYLLDELESSTQLVRGSADVLQGRLAILDASRERLTVLRNRIAVVLSHPSSGFKLES
jgi:hypothetical protein